MVQKYILAVLTTYLSLGKEGPKASGQFQELSEALALLPIVSRSFPLEDPES